MAVPELAPLPHVLYRLAPAGTMTPLLAAGVEPDLTDPRWAALSDPRVWSASPAAGPESTDGRWLKGGLPGTWLLPLKSNGALAGGLALVASDRVTKLARSTQKILDDAALDRLLEMRLLGLHVQKERDELRAFRRGTGEALPYGFMGLDPLGRVLYVGGRAEEILGVTEREAAGLDCTRVFRPVGVNGENPLLDGLKGRPVPMELYLARPDGREIPIWLQVSRVPVGSEHRPGLVAFFRDLTEERALAEAESQRDRLAALGELSAGVAHEIRNPLTGIANCAQVLKEGLIAEGARQRFLDIILEEAARLNRIVEGLLCYARPNRPELREHDVVDCARKVLELEAAQLAERGIRARLSTRGRVPRIYVDPGQIEQVLLNLVRNASDAMPDGGEIRLEAAVIQRLLHRRRGVGRRSGDRFRVVREGPRARFVQVKVVDSGPGIKKELLSRIWNPFFTTRARGTGLGLSLSLAIVREHGGTLTARSVEGKGTTILMDLPIERRQGERRSHGR